jgi:dTDP-4-amino-4,6-dideoxygalactose transaminase
MASLSRIYLSPPDVGDDERQALLEAFDSNWIAPVGPDLEKFELEIAARIGVPDAVAVASGTAALHLALLLVDVQGGDEVVVPTLTFAASVFAARYVSATPVFIDVSEQTWTLDPGLLEEELSRRNRTNSLPKAVMAVDLYGQCCDYPALLQVCQRYDIPIVEDAAEALGSTCGAQQAGSFGRVGVISFNGNKIITTSGGGILLSEDQSLMSRARKLSTQAREPLPYYEHTEIGYNYRLSNLLAALGRAQLRHLDEKINRRRAVNAYYRQAMAKVPGISFMPEATYGRSNCWLTCAQIDPDQFGCDSEGVRLELERHNIEARPAWKPMHLQPVFRGYPTVGGSIAELIFERGLCLPSGSSLNVDELEWITKTITALVT